jgi:beta-galactosidase
MPLPSDFMVGLYDRLHETPMQRKFRTIRPMPAGVVFIQWPEMGEEDIRAHFRAIRELGFSCLKGIGLMPGMDMAKVMLMALEEGLIPWWYDEGGWEEITPALLRKLKIDPSLPVEKVREHPAMRAHQLQALRRRVLRQSKQDRRRLRRKFPFEIPFSPDHLLAPKALPYFFKWLKARYGTIEKLRDAWNAQRLMKPHWRKATSWSALRRRLGEIIEENLRDRSRDFRRTCDVLRFKADVHLDRTRRYMAFMHGLDPDEPHRAGGEMGLFLPFAARATDMEGIADVMSEYGSFYPSIHLGWHFEEVDFEITRPVYMMSSLVTDWAKGIWCAAWESTGGPQQLSHGKAPYWPPAAGKTAGFTVDGGVMTQLMLSYLAGGFKGFGFWCWTARATGFEVGEYGLTDRQGKPSDRAVQAGHIARAARRLRDELWQARKEPLVGVYVDWGLSAMWAAMAVGGRDHFKHIPMQARTGVGRALINHNVPWEHVTGADLRGGLAGRYRAIYLPAAFMLAGDILDILLNYARQGGRVVLDLPGAGVDEYGRMLKTGHSTPFEQLFGCVLRDLQYSSNVPRKLFGQTLAGFVADLAPTSARTVAAFDNGLPAITEARVGEGSGVILGYEASLSCFKPGNTQAEEWLVRHALGDLEPPYVCRGAIAYRLAAPQADHYFLINDAPATEAELDTKAFRYRSACDAVTREELRQGAPIELPAYSGRWLRFEKEP